MADIPNNAELPPRDLEMEARSWEAYCRGDSMPLQERINELYMEILRKHFIELAPETQAPLQDAIVESLMKPLLNRIATLRQELATMTKCKQALELLDKGPVTSVSVLEFGGYNITVKSGAALVSCEYNGLPLADAILSAGKVILN